MLRVKDSLSPLYQQKEKLSKTSSGRLHAQTNIYIAFSKISATAFFDNKNKLYVYNIVWLYTLPI